MDLQIPKEKYSGKIIEVTLGATEADGGTRSHVVKVGGESIVGFDAMDGEAPNKPVVAMEVFDQSPRNFPQVLRDCYGDLLDKPAEMAKRCVEEYGAELISVRLIGAHPDKGNKSPEECAEIIKAVLESVSVPIIVTGTAHFEKNNKVMRKVGEACAGENLLLNWVETDNYKTIAAAAMGYGHCVTAVSPLDINMAKQLNILASGVGLEKNRIVMDPLVSPVGYGLDYSYTISERIKLAALSGDAMLGFPILLNVGFECSKIKELHASEAEYPSWGNLNERAAVWEIITASSLLIAGGNIFILYHPKAVEVIKNKIETMVHG